MVKKNVKKLTSSPEQISQIWNSSSESLDSLPESAARRNYIVNKTASLYFTEKAAYSCKNILQGKRISPKEDTADL